MHQYTHAWLAFMAIKRLEKGMSSLTPEDHKYAERIVEWFQNNKDCVIQGAWYPDLIIKDNKTSHILKIKPYDDTDKTKNKMRIVDPKGFKSLPEEYACFREWGKASTLRQQSFTIDQNTNLPDRCESFTQTVIDHLKIQWYEEKGSPVAPTSNQVAHLLFMQSHYIADAHMPLHCDARPFSEGKDLHAKMEDEWEKKVIACFKIDTSDPKNPRFSYDKDGYPMVSNDQEYQGSYLKKVDDEMIKREMKSIDASFRSENNNVWDFISAICQNSYLVSYHFFKPEIKDPTKEDFNQWKAGHEEDFKTLSFAVLADAADSIARVWLRAWRRYEDWKNPPPDKDKKKEEENKQPAPG
jgi:hypothetical protein